MDTHNVTQKVEALLARMTLEQKIGQMTQPERAFIRPDEVTAYHIGSILSGGGSCPGANVPADWVAMNDAYWAASMATVPGHVPIPLLYGVDAIHGNANVLGATVFPHNIGLGAAHDPDLLERVAQATAREILATGVEWTFAPTLAVARDDRWGRTYESYSEHPDIVTTYAPRFVRGLQSDLGPDRVVACAKHFMGDGATTFGVDQGDTALSRAELERLCVPPYRAAIEAGVLTVMISLSTWNRERCHGHRELITDILKGDLGFRGLVVSDWDGIDILAKDFSKAVALGVNAGMDVFMVTSKWKQFIEHLMRHVAWGTVPVARIDDAVRRILTVKYAYGLFDRPRPAQRPWSNHASFGSTAHREVAREAVRKSLVLLQDKNHTLPLRKGARILVAGKNAHSRGNQCGGFTVAWQGVRDNESIRGGTSVFEGIRRVAPDAVLSPDGSAAEAGAFDVAVVVIGETPYAEGIGDVPTEGAPPVGRRMGSAAGVEMDDQQHKQGAPDTELRMGSGGLLRASGRSLVLAIAYPEDLQTIKTITAKGIPVVAVLISGRPLVVNEELAETSAFVAAWLPGSEGEGVADVLFGDCDFHGRLSFSWPRNPVDHANWGEQPYTPLFPYGYGLTMAG